jgi:hypothetical protein
MKGGCPLALLFILKRKFLLSLATTLLVNCLTPILTVTISGIGIAGGIVNNSAFKGLLEFPDPF